MSALPSRMYIEQRLVKVDDHAEVLRLCGNLLKTGKQFAVAPFPDDTHTLVQTHWSVSWPAPHVTYQRSTAA